MSRPPEESTKRRLELEVRSEESALERAPRARQDDAGDRQVEEGFDEIESETVVAVLSKQGRGGEWESPDHVRAVAFWGHVELDFREACLPPGGIVDIDCRAIMGAIEIRIPSGSLVEIDGLPLLGSFEQKTRGRGVTERIRDWVRGEDPEPEVDPDMPPVFHVRGLALMGTVEIK